MSILTQIARSARQKITSLRHPSRISQACDLGFDALPSRPARILIGMRHGLVMRRMQQLWVVGRGKSFDAYKAEVLDEDRLALRLRLLKNVMLPSLLSQTAPFDEQLNQLAIFTSTELPPGHAAGLAELVAPYPWIRLVAVDPDEVGPVFERETRRSLEASGSSGAVYYASVRLDDDDALARNFMERLSAYVVEEVAGKIVSFPRGYSTRIGLQERKYLSFHTYNYPKIALGLAYIGAFDGEGKRFLTRYPTIYDVGKHTSVDRRAHTILDASFPAFVRTRYDGQDRQIVAIKEPEVERSVVESAVTLQDII